MTTTNEMDTTDIVWEEIKSLAVEQQQCFYELLSDWIEYKYEERKILRQNIGFAIFGAPKSNENTLQDTTPNNDTVESNSCYWKPEASNDANADICDTVNYDEKAKSVIYMIYNKICECTIGANNDQPIYFGTIYNIIFRSKMNLQSKKLEKDSETETKTEEKESPKEQEEEEFATSLIPIFKIRRNIQKTSDTAKNAEQIKYVKTQVETDYETWYIDHGGRVYKSWADYIENNNLPKCTMVLPKDGVYQADPSCRVTEDYSTVWLEVTESAACKWTATLCNGIDAASSIAGFGAAALSVASLFTPLAPVTVTAGLVATGASSIWMMGRSSQQLVDRSIHEESIHILDKDALPHWIGIAGTTVGLGAAGGSAAISRVVASGKTIPTFAKVAFNTIQGGNLLLNGAGIVYQGYHMIDKYKTDKSVSSIDALNLAIHIMFFTGAVVKVQFANDIIESTQGKIINDYKDSLRKKNLRRKFNRIVRKAADNNTCKISENAQVIQYIKNREMMLSANQPANQPAKQSDNLSASQQQSIACSKTNETLYNNITWSFEQGKLKVNGVTLLDPVAYVTRLLKSDIFNENYQNNSSNNKSRRNKQDDDYITDELKNIFSDLLSKFYTSDACPRSKNLPLIPDFELLLKDMNSMKIGKECLIRLFKIVEKLMKRSKDKADFLLMAFTLVWQFCKANLKEWGILSELRMRSHSGSNILQKIIIALSEAIDIDMILDNLFRAFVIYLDAN